jgi:hypothetical protein
MLLAYLIIDIYAALHGSGSIQQRERVSRRSCNDLRGSDRGKSSLQLDRQAKSYHEKA